MNSPIDINTDITSAHIGSHLGYYYLHGYLQGALHKGLDPEKILAQAGIPLSHYHSADAMINGEELHRLIMALRETLNDHYMGFLQVPGKLAMDLKAGHAAVKGGTLGEGLRQLGDFINAVRSDEERECVIDKHSDEFWFIFRFSGFIDSVDPHLLYFYRLSWGYKFYCWLIGQKIPLTKVCFSSPKFDQSINYEEVFHCTVEFSQPHDKLCFDQKYLLQPIMRNEVELYNKDFPLNYPNLYTIPGRDQRLSSQVEQILIELYQEGISTPSLEVVANILAKSPRTLSRKLREESEAFQKIKSKVRCDLAIKLLNNTDIPVAGIATKIGFAEPGDFTRAFVGWLGQTPSAFRSQQGSPHKRTNR